MSKGPVLTNYVSEIDQFLQNFDESNPAQSRSQEKEIAKYKRIYALRDQANRPDATQTLWENF
jgi:hypothetical protein